jgi:nitrate/nitrite transporter NarK
VNDVDTIRKAEGILWMPLMLVIFIVSMALLAQMNFAPVLPIIQKEFAITSVWAGVIATATLLSHTMLQIPGGQLANMLGGKRGLTIGTVIVGASVFAAGLAPNFVVLLLCRFVLGFGTALSFVTGLSVANTLGPRSKAAQVQGAFGASASIGILIALLTSERLASMLTWRGMFLVEGAFMLAVGLIATRFLPSVTARRIVVTESWMVTLRQPVLYVLGLAHCLSYGVFMSLAAWITVFLWKQHGIGLEWAGPLSAVFAISGVLARSTGGKLSVGRERLIIIAACVITSVLVFLLPIVPGVVAALVVAVILGWFANMAFGPIFGYYTLVSPKPVSGREFGVINFVGNIGALVFPPLIGYALDSSGSFVEGLAIIAACGIVGSLVVAFLLPTRRLAEVASEVKAQKETQNEVQNEAEASC